MGRPSQLASLSRGTFGRAVAFAGMNSHTGPRILLVVLAVSALCVGAVYALSLVVRDEAGRIDPKESVIAPAGPSGSGG